MAKTIGRKSRLNDRKRPTRIGLSIFVLIFSCLFFLPMERAHGQILISGSRVADTNRTALAAADVTVTGHNKNTPIIYAIEVDTFSSGQIDDPHTTTWSFRVNGGGWTVLTTGTSPAKLILSPALVNNSTVTSGERIVGTGCGSFTTSLREFESSNSLVAFERVRNDECTETQVSIDLSAATGGDFEFKISQEYKTGIPTLTAELIGSAHVIVTDVPAQVTGLTATAVSGQINLSWTAPADNGSPITGYKIERRVCGGGWSDLVADTGNTATTYSDTTVTGLTCYGYKVSAINALGTGPASAEKTATALGPADEATSTITAALTVLRADGTSTSTITVQLKDANGTNFTTGGDTVTLATSLGSWSGIVIDNNDGTYTRTLISSTTDGTATITGTVNGPAITDNATVLMIVSSLVFDAASSNSSSNSTCTVSHTTGGGADGILIVGVDIFSATTSVVSPITYGAQSLTFIRRDTETGDGNSSTELWYLVNPTAGAGTITVNLTASRDVVCGAVTFFGADTAAPIRAHNGSNGSGAPSVTVTSVAGDYVVDTVSSVEGNHTVGPDQTERWGLQPADLQGYGSTEFAISTSTVMSWNNTALHSISAVSIKTQDTTPPSPISFSSPPADASPTSISMTATTASDTSTPVEYQFTYTACAADAGTGGDSRLWDVSTTYTDTGLQVNQCYGYTVNARDSVPNTGTASSSAEAYTAAAVPGTPILGGATATTLNLTNAENSNPAANPTTLFAVQVVTTSPNDATWLNKWVDATGNPSATAVWMSDATLDALTLQGLTENQPPMGSRSRPKTEILMKRP